MEAEALVQALPRLAPEARPCIGDLNGPDCLHRGGGDLPGHGPKGGGRCWVASRLAFKVEDEVFAVSVTTDPGDDFLEESKYSVEFWKLDCVLRGALEPTSVIGKRRQEKEYWKRATQLYYLSNGFLKMHLQISGRAVKELNNSSI